MDAKEHFTFRLMLQLNNPIEMIIIIIIIRPAYFKFIFLLQNYFSLDLSLCVQLELHSTSTKRSRDKRKVIFIFKDILFITGCGCFLTVPYTTTNSNFKESNQLYCLTSNLYKYVLTFEVRRGRNLLKLKSISISFIEQEMPYSMACLSKKKKDPIETRMN